MTLDSIKWNDVRSIYSYVGNRLRVADVLFRLILLITLASCDGIAADVPIASPEASTQQPEPLRPEPQEPHIVVFFSGLDENALVRIYIHTLSGDTPLTGSHPGNGEMKLVLPEHQGVTYIVSAEAEGYVSDPIRYTIQLSGTNFYLVENGQKTSSEVQSLKFQFKPIFTPR
jgi:hypothetical protein